MEGQPVFMTCLAASSSPRATDEALSYFLCDLEGVAGINGGLTAVIVGLGDYCIVHLFDQGFR